MQTSFIKGKIRMPFLLDSHRSLIPYPMKCKYLHGLNSDSPPIAITVKSNLL